MSPELVIKPVPGRTDHRPENLVWGYIYDPSQKYIWHMKYNYFGLRSVKNCSRIRCHRCYQLLTVSERATKTGFCDICSKKEEEEARQTPQQRYRYPDGVAWDYPEGYPEGRNLPG